VVTAPKKSVRSLSHWLSLVGCCFLVIDPCPVSADTISNSCGPQLNAAMLLAMSTSAALWAREQNQGTKIFAGQIINNANIAWEPV
jgi:hypothetical protein